MEAETGVVSKPVSYTWTAGLVFLTDRTMAPINGNSGRYTIC